MRGQHIKVEGSDPYSSSMGGLRYVSDSGRLLPLYEQPSHQNLGEQHQEGSDYALAGDLEMCSTFYNPLADNNVGRHLDSLRDSVTPLQVLDPLTCHSSHVADPELRNAGVHLSLTNQYSL